MAAYGAAAGSEWGTSVQVSDLGAANRINPTIAVDGQGNVHAAWQHFYGCTGCAVTGDIEFARQPAGAGWERRCPGERRHRQQPRLAAGHRRRP